MCCMAVWVYVCMQFSQKANYAHIEATECVRRYQHTSMECEQITFTRYMQ